MKQAAMPRPPTQPTTRSQFCLLICLVCLSIALSLAAQAQTRVPPPLPPSAQEAFDKGIIAAQEGGYVVAIRYLQDARKIAPQAPQIFRSLGAVEAKVPGRELRAIAWYAAYLAAIPNATDSAEVKKEIVRLEVKSKINISGLIKQLQDMAGHTSVYRDGTYANLNYVVKLWTEAGDITQAIRTADLIQSDNIYGDDAQQTIATAQAEAGDIAGALRTAGLIRRADSKIVAQVAVAEAQIKAGDIVGAKTTLASAKKSVALIEGIEFYRSIRWTAIANAQAESGDVAGALETADLIQDPSRKGEAQQIIAIAQAEAGDIAGALKTADIIQGAVWKSSAQMRIIEAQIKTGDIVGTQKTANIIQDPILQSYAQSLIGRAQRQVAIAQAGAGDIAGALKTVNLIQNANWKKLAQSEIAEAKTGSANALNSTRQATSSTKPSIQPAIPVFDWLKKLDDGDKSNDCPLNTEPFLDLAGYLESLRSSGEPQKYFESLHATAKKIVRAQNVIEGMLKQQAKQ